MAKASAPISARLVATINARYYPVEGVADAYCLNGRFPGKRELRAVNTTLDRESRGFIVSLFGYPSDGRAQSSVWQEPLSRLAEQVESDRGDIDNDINDLAETAMDVTGRIRLGDEASREPYFSGVIIRDGEMAAVTVGDSLAFVYRHEALYPLTSSQLTFEPADLYGDPVEGFEDFIAGEAGTIRYSNIAQIEQGDWLILCNSEVFDVIGQSQLMRYLEDAEDSMDAAGLILTAAASQMPGTPMQVAVTEIVSIKSEEHTATRFSLGRFATQAMEPVVEPVQESPDVDFARTQRYQRQDMVDMMKPAPESNEAPNDEDWKREVPVEQDDAKPFYFDKPTASFDDVEDSPFAPYRAFDEKPESVKNDRFYEDDDFADRQPLSAQEDLPVFAYNSEAQRRRQTQSTYNDYDHQDVWETGDDIVEDDRDFDPYGEFDYEDDPYERKPQRSSDRTRRIAFYVILIAIIIVCIVALIKLLAGGGKTPSPEESTTTTTTTTQSVPLVDPSDTTPQTPASEDTTTTTTADTSGDTTYTVKAGDSLWTICSKHYGRVSEKLCDKLAKYNGMRDMNQNIFLGQELKLPPLEKLLAD